MERTDTPIKPHTAQEKTHQPGGNPARTSQPWEPQSSAEWKQGSPSKQCQLTAGFEGVSRAPSLSASIKALLPLPVLHRSSSPRLPISGWGSSGEQHRTCCPAALPSPPAPKEAHAPCTPFIAPPVSSGEPTGVFHFHSLAGVREWLLLLWASPGPEAGTGD